MLIEIGILVYTTVSVYVETEDSECSSFLEGLRVSSEFLIDKAPFLRKFFRSGSVMVGPKLFVLSGLLFGSFS